jgi:hypothetical protein
LVALPEGWPVSAPFLSSDYAIAIAIMGCHVVARLDFIPRQNAIAILVALPEGLPVSAPLLASNYTIAIAIMGCHVVAHFCGQCQSAEYERTSQAGPLSYHHLGTPPASIKQFTCRQ